MKKIVLTALVLLLALVLSCTNNDSEFDQFKDAAAYVLDKTYSSLSSDRENFKEDMESIKENIAEAENLEDAQDALSDSILAMMFYLYMGEENESACIDIVSSTAKKYPKTESYLSSL